MARLHGLKRPSRAEIEQLMLKLMPEDRPGDFVQAMMDLGAIICRPKSPRCGECPLAADCKAFAAGAPEGFPHRKARAARPHKFGVVWWIERDGSVWLVRRPAEGLLGGMAALPGGDWTDAPPERLNMLGTLRHVFTHFSLDLHIASRTDPQGEGWWQPLDRLNEAGLPTIYRKAAELALARNDRLAA
jgi:A/G-specific adenine glycosylase